MIELERPEVDGHGMSNGRIAQQVDQSDRTLHLFDQYRNAQNTIFGGISNNKEAMLVKDKGAERTAQGADGSFGLCND